ncbi:MAG TPA: histidine kinase [Planctomycetes bacterium]|nr:histidine kinase [Planctomycetota bacterium]
MKIPGQDQVAAVASAEPNTEKALDDLVGQLIGEIGAHPDIALVFLSPHHRDKHEAFQMALGGELQAEAISGCTAAGVIGAGHEIQGGPGISIWAAKFPGSRVQDFHLELDEGGGFVRGWPDVGPEAGVVLLADPFTFPLDPFFSSLRQVGRYPPIVGGLASGADRSGGNVFFEGSRRHSSGAAGFVVQGGVKMAPILSQGCRAIGPPFVVTRSEKNIIYELGGQPAYQGLSEVVRSLEASDRRSFASAPHVGIQAEKGLSEGSPGGFLVRGVMGVDSSRGTVSVADFVEEGAMMQFHTRDADTAHQDLDDLLSLESGFQPTPLGALLFSCSGRGIPLFGKADHDVEIVEEFFPQTPVAGMFAAGEIGPVCGRPYIHGFSASLGLFLPDSERG